MPAGSRTSRAFIAALVVVVVGRNQVGQYLEASGGLLGMMDRTRSITQSKQVNVGGVARRRGNQSSQDGEYPYSIRLSRHIILLLYVCRYLDTPCSNPNYVMLCYAMLIVRHHHAYHAVLLIKFLPFFPPGDTFLSCGAKLPHVCNNKYNHEEKFQACFSYATNQQTRANLFICNDILCKDPAR